MWRKQLFASAAEKLIKKLKENEQGECKKGRSGNRTRDLSHPKRASYL